MTSSTNSTSSPSMLSSRSLAMRTMPGAPVLFEKLEIDLHGKLYVARQRGQKVHRALEHADQLHRAAGIRARDLGANFADAPVDFLFGEEDLFDSRRRGAHTVTGRAASPYLKMRFSKSFW